MLEIGSMVSNKAKEDLIFLMEIIMKVILIKDRKVDKE